MQQHNTSSTAPATALVKFAEMREHLGVSRSGLYKMIRERRIPYKKVGVEYRFDREEIKAWLDRRSVKARV